MRLGREVCGGLPVAPIRPVGATSLAWKVKPRHVALAAQKDSRLENVVLSVVSHRHPTQRPEFMREVGRVGTSLDVHHVAAVLRHAVRFAVVVKWHAHLVRLSERRTS